MNTEFENLTVEQLMGQDYYVWLTTSKEKGLINIHFEDEEGKETIYDNMHPYVVENFYTLCKNFIYRYEILIKQNSNINPSDMRNHLLKKAG